MERHLNGIQEMGVRFSPGPPEVEVRRVGLVDCAHPRYEVQFLPGLATGGSNPHRTEPMAGIGDFTSEMWQSGNATVLKTVDRVKPAGVRSPPSPPTLQGSRYEGFVGSAVS